MVRMVRGAGAFLLSAGFALAGHAQAYSSCAEASCAEAPRAEAKSEPLTPDWCKSLPRPGYAKLERVHLEAASNWFEVYRVRPGVFAIYEPHQYEEVISYLITGSNRALLFDTGLGMGDIKPVVLALTKLPVTVLNSHTHFDHIGGNWEFDDVWGVDSAYTRINMAGATTAQLAEEVIPLRFCGALPAQFKPAAYAIPGFHIAHFVKDGEVIDLGGRTIEVLFTPGHTPDALALLDRENRLLFTGDSYYAGPIFLYVPETNLDAYRQSLVRLTKLVPQLDLLLPSHNFPAEKPEVLTRLLAALDQSRAGTAQSEENGGLREYKFDGFSLLLKK